MRLPMIVEGGGDADDHDAQPVRRAGADRQPVGLLSSLVTGDLLAWILPMGYVAFCEYALLQSWTNPWTWPVRPPDDRGAWLCACAVYAVGLAAFTIRGARTRLADDS